MSTQHGRSHLIGATKSSRRLAFSTPMGVTVVAVLAAAIIGAFLLFGLRGPFGIGLGPSPTALSPVEPTPTVEPTSVPTVEPTPIVEQTPTLEPKPSPVPLWTGLEWSEPMAPGLAVFEAIWWNDRYVGVGYAIPDNDPAPPCGTTHIPVFLSSHDGVTWTVVQELASYVDDSQSKPHPVNVVPVGDDGLLAWSGFLWGGGPRILWWSEDGDSWTEVDSPSWHDGWQGHATTMAGGASGVVAIGAQGSGCCMNPDGPAIIGHSADGRAWTWLSDAPVFAHASFTDVKATRDGFVLVGWIGETWVEAGASEAQEPLGRPAAWTSHDGVNWTAADVDGPEIRGGKLMQVLVGADGLLASGIAGPHEHSWQPTTAWASTDGRSWTRLGEFGRDLPEPRVLLSNGSRMVILGVADPATSTLAGWTSSDSSSWSTLRFSGAPAPAADLPDGPATEPGALKPGYVREEWPPTRLIQDGVVAQGWTPVGPTWADGSADAAWVARAVGP